jgi:hypothetical protein
MQFSLTGRVSELDFNSVLWLAVSRMVIEMVDLKPEILAISDCTAITTPFQRQYLVFTEDFQGLALKRVQLTMFY